MRRLIRRQGVIGMVSFLAAPIIAALTWASCDADAIRIGECSSPSARVIGSGVQLSADETTGRAGSGGGSGRGGSGAPDPDAWNEQREAEARARGNHRDRFEIVNPPTPPTVVSINDLASFAPAVGGNHMEPNGWIVVGLDTNFYSERSPRVVDGTLLGLPAAVRFTPVAWRWSYGDGSTKASATPGASWAAQNLHEFDPTATSHVFANPGSYAIDLTVEYSAEYQFAGAGWAAVAGTLELPANRIVATASDANTVLVNHDCRHNPGGPGC